MKKSRITILFGVFLFIWALIGCNRPVPTIRKATENAAVPSAEPLSLTRTSLAGQIMATLTAVNVTPGLITEAPTKAVTSAIAETAVPAATEPIAVTSAVVVTAATAVSAATAVTSATAAAAAPATQTPLTQATPYPTIKVVTLPPRGLAPTATQVAPVPSATQIAAAPSATQVAPAAPEPIAPRPAQFVSALPEVYYLHKGEFPWCLARRFDVNPRQLMWVNGFFYGQIFYPGQAVFFPLNPQPFPGNRALRPHPVTHSVYYRETIFSIACYYGDIDPFYLAEINGIDPPYRLSFGQLLQLP